MPNLVESRIVPKFIHHIRYKYHLKSDDDLKSALKSFGKQEAWEYISHFWAKESTIDTQRRTSILYDSFEKLIADGDYTNENPFPSNISMKEEMRWFWETIKEFYNVEEKSDV